MFRLAFKVPPLISLSTQSSRCVAGIVGQDVGIDAWVVGDVFLRTEMSVYDATAMTVGFASLA